MRAMLMGAAAAALAIATAGGAQAADKVKACCIYTGPIGDFGYSYQHDQGRLAAAKALGDKVDARPIVENVPGQRRRTRDRAARAQRLQHHLHHLVRLHGPDDQGRQEVPERDVRARDRLQARAQRLDLRRQVLRGALRDGPDRRQDDQVQHDRLHRLVPDPRGRLRHRRVRARPADHQSQRQDQDRLGQHLVRSGQGSRRRQGADRSGRRHPDPAHRLGRAAAGGGEGGHARLRPIVRHDEVRARRRS